MRHSWIVATLAMAGMATAAAGEARARPVVAELFTSEGCSSCPPADALLGEIAGTRPDVLALSFHVTYWDRLGWPDPFSLPEATARQRAYAVVLGLDTIYTPQLVVEGTREVVGSDRPAVAAALRGAEAEAIDVPLDLARVPGGVRVTAGGGRGRATLLLVGYDGRHRTTVRRGENAGQVLTEVNVVRELRMVAAWNGAPIARDAALPAGEHVAALLQGSDGRIFGAARLE